jgi:hypothetical protein
MWKPEPSDWEFNWATFFQQCGPEVLGEFQIWDRKYDHEFLGAWTPRKTWLAKLSAGVNCRPVL